MPDVRGGTLERFVLQLGAGTRVVSKLYCATKLAEEFVGIGFKCFEVVANPIRWGCSIYEEPGRQEPPQGGDQDTAQRHEIPELSIGFTVITGVEFHKER